MLVKALTRAADGSWRDLATRAASAVDRPSEVAQAARAYEPELGDFTPTERRRVLSAMEEILDGPDAPYVVPLHTSQAYWVPSMLDDGFRWTRPRMDVDGVPYEPYEDKLREYHGLGAGEVSEDFLFTDVRMVPRRRPWQGFATNPVRQRRSVPRSSACG